VDASRLKAWLQERGILPDNVTLALAALAVSIEDWKAELKRSRQRQTRTHEEDEWPN